MHHCMTTRVPPWQLLLHLQCAATVGKASRALPVAGLMLATNISHQVFGGKEKEAQKEAIQEAKA
jgi:hypothetical protein